MVALEALQEQVRNHLKPSRYKHTLGVMHFALKLAKVHRVCEKKVSYAALLHDYCKYESDAVILEYLKTQNALIHPVIKNTPNLGHGFIAAHVARKEFNIQDDRVLKAIEHHTFGCPNMSDLEKIIYLADSLEENRTYDGIEQLRILAMRNLNTAIIAVSGQTMMYELSKGHMIHEHTVLMRNALLEEA